MQWKCFIIAYVNGTDPAILVHCKSRKLSIIFYTLILLLH